MGPPQPCAGGCLLGNEPAAAEQPLPRFKRFPASVGLRRAGLALHRGFPHRGFPPPQVSGSPVFPALPAVFLARWVSQVTHTHTPAVCPSRWSWSLLSARGLAGIWWGAELLGAHDSSHCGAGGMQHTPAPTQPRSVLTVQWALSPTVCASPPQPTWAPAAPRAPGGTSKVGGCWPHTLTRVTQGHTRPARLVDQLLPAPGAGSLWFPVNA